MSDCDLCSISMWIIPFHLKLGAEVEDKPYIILCICKNCNIPMVVAREHRPSFTTKERELIMEAFLGKKIRWKMRSNFHHAHCHIEG